MPYFFLEKKYKYKATAGPIPKAYSKVPIPTTPPKNHPIKTTKISIQNLTKAMGAFVFFCKPVISPSRGPAPKFAIKYMAVPNPTVITPITTKKN